MSKTQITSAAFTAGQRAAGLVLGLPFFLASFFLAGGGGSASGKDAWEHWAIVFLLLVVCPSAAILSAALAASVAPAGRARSYAGSTACGFAVLWLTLALLFGALRLYALWPVRSGKTMWLALTTAPAVPLLLVISLLVPLFFALGLSLGRRAGVRPAGLTARLLARCWKLSRNPPSAVSRPL